VPSADVGGGNNNDGIKGNGGGGGGGGGGGSEGDSGPGAAAAALLASVGKSLDAIPSDMQAKVVSGLIPLEILQRYIKLEANLLTRMLMKVPGFRNKLLADPSFAFKVGIEVGIGIVTKCSAELQKRGQNFKKEMDFVLANVLMALIADFMLVWLPAPAVSYGAAAAKKRALSLSKALPFLSKLPKNAFQKVPPGMQPYTLAQRVGVIGTNGAKLFGVGTFASFVGVAVTNTLIAVRERLGDAEDGQDSKPQTQNVLATSALYGGYMGINSNLRYQAVAGFEERVLSKLFAGGGKRFSTACAALRIANTYAGSLLWIDTLRLFGMQPKANA